MGSWPLYAGCEGEVKKANLWERKRSKLHDAMFETRTLCVLVVLFRATILLSSSKQSDVLMTVMRSGSPSRASFWLTM